MQGILTKEHPEHRFYMCTNDKQDFIDYSLANLIMSIKQNIENYLNTSLAASLVLMCTFSHFLNSTKSCPLIQTCSSYILWDIEGY